MNRPLKSTLSAALIAALMVGCGSHGQQRIIFDGTPEGLRKAVAEIAGKLKPEQQKEVQTALELYLDDQGAEPSSLRTVVPIESLSGAALSDFLAQARRINEAEADVRADEHPVWVNPRLVEIMKLELQALADNRAKLNAAGFFTLDELPFTAPSFIPPPNTEVRVENNKAIFAFRMSNKSGLTIYRPTFNVRVEVPGEPLPIYTGKLVWEDPVGVPDGSSRLVDLSCCSIVREPYLNKRLRQLDERARISVELLSVEDYRKRNPLRTVGYTTRDQERERDLVACIADVETRIDVWTPQRSVPACRRLSRTSRTGSEQLASAVNSISTRVR